MTFLLLYGMAINCSMCIKHNGKVSLIEWTMFHLVITIRLNNRTIKLKCTIGLEVVKFNHILYRVSKMIGETKLYNDATIHVTSFQLITKALIDTMFFVKVNNANKAQIT